MAAEQPRLLMSVEDAGVTYTVRTQRSRRFLGTNETRDVHALRGVTFTLIEGEVLGVVGRNGAGKSTLLASLSGSIQCTEGHVLVSSQPKALSVFSFMNTRLSGRANIELGLLGLGHTPEECHQLSANVIAFSELEDFIDLPVSTYSAGMKARLRFAVATQQTPEILLLDEALAVGDQYFRDKAIDRINEIREAAGAVVLASHNMNEIRKSCSKVLWLEKGRPLMIGDTDNVVKQYMAEQRRPH